MTAMFTDSLKILANWRNVQSLETSELEACPLASVHLMIG
jgi:hypothetical protein